MKDYATSLIIVAPYPSNSGTTITVKPGTGVRFPDAPFKATVHPALYMPDLDNAEKVLVTAKNGDVFTIQRAQTPTTAKYIKAGDRISNALFVDDIQNLGAVSSVNGYKGAVTLTKNDISLGNVDNTPDTSKPVSGPQQTAINAKADTTYVDSQNTAQDAITANKVDKVTGKVLSTNDYTTAEQTKLAAISGTNTGDQTLSVSGQNLTISGPNGNTVTVNTGGQDATTTAKGVVQLAGDLGGFGTTAASPRVKNIQRVFNVKDYGALGDGSTDDLAAIQAAVLACLAAGGGTIYSPAGTYMLSNHVVIIGSNFIFKGAGPDATTFKLLPNANSEVIVWGDAVTALYNVKFCDFTIDGNRANQPAAGPGTAGSERVGLRLRCDAQNCYYAVVENIHAKNTRHNGISVESANYTSVINCFSEYNDQFGIWWENGSNVVISNNFMQYNDFGGMKVLSAGNGSIAHNVSKGDYGLGMGFQGVGSVSIVGNSAYRPGWRGSSTQATTGLTVSLSDNVSFIGNSVFGAYGDGMQVNGTKNSSFIGNTFRRNGQQTDATYSDLLLTNAGGGAAVTNCVFIGNTFENDNPTYYSNKAAYNIRAAQANTHVGNIFRDNIFGTPVTAVTSNLASTDGTPGAIDNLFGTNKGLNPEWFNSIGYLPSGTYTLDPANGNFQVAAGYQGVSTVALASGIFRGQKMTFKFNQDVGNKSISWSGSNISWSGGFAPVFSGVPYTDDVIDFVWDGSKWYGKHTALKPHYKQYGYFSASQTIDPNVDGDVIIGTGYNSPTTLTIANGRNIGQQFTLIFNQDVGNKTLTWPNNVQWDAGVAPTLSTAANTFNIINFTWAGSNWVGTYRSTPGISQATADGRYLQLTGGTLSGPLNVTVPSNYAGLNLTGQNGQLSLLGGGSGDNQNYIESANAAGTANVPLNITGYQNNIGSTINLKFSNVNLSGKITNLTAGTTSTDAVNLGQLAPYAPLASPALTGTPTAPTAAKGNNSTQLATTAYVDTSLNSYNNYGYFNATQTISAADGRLLYGTGYQNVSNVSITNGTVAGQAFTLIFAQDVGNKQISWSGTNIQWAEGVAPVFSGTANTVDVIHFSWNGTNWYGTWSPNQALLALKAPLASPALTGTPTAPTASAGTNTTQLATTAFVSSAVSAVSSGVNRIIAAITAATTGATATKTDYVYYWTGSTAYTFTLPSAASVGSNLYVIKNTGTVNQTFNTTSSQTVDGSTSGTVVPGQSLEVVSNGSNWIII